MKLNPLGWQNPERPIRGSVLFSKVWGSWSHDTQIPSSDVDYTGVYIANTKEVLGLQPPPDTLTGEKPDYQFHEVKKFCGLLLKGNPGVIEMLYTEKLYWADPRWETIKKERERLLCHTVVKQYLGYSQAQLKRFRSGKPVHATGGIPGEKWCYHMVRVAFDAARIASGEGPKVWKEGHEKGLLMSIRNGKTPTAEAVKIAEQIMSDIDASKPWAVPEKADTEFLNDWLLSMREVS